MPLPQLGLASRVKRHPWPAVALALAFAEVALYRKVLRPWMYSWGARRDEVDALLPGDGLVSTHTPRTTRAVTIRAPVEAVWPWLVQIGEDRGGFYSYSALERAVGVRTCNADIIRPEWQDLHVGETVWLARRYGEPGRQVVAAVQPRSHLVLVSASDFRQPQRGGKAFGAWAFHLRPELPVWLVNSGPLDDSAEQRDIPPTAQVAKLASRVGARGHVTFGGRLEPGAKGFPASAMAKTEAGDWRSPAHVRRGVTTVINELHRPTITHQA